MKAVKEKVYLTRRAANLWAYDIINPLFVGKEVVIVVAHEGRGYRPEVKIEKIDNVAVRTFDHEIASTMGGRDSWITIHTNWGIYCSIVDLSIDADERSLRIKVLTDSGEQAWWVFKLIDPKGKFYRVFQKVMEQSWAISNEPAKKETA